MRAVLSLDAGTTGVAAFMVAPDGSVLGHADAEIPQYYPQPGWVEHDAMEIWLAAQSVARQAIRQAGCDPAAIGIANQRETTLLWERGTGTPVGRAIVWQDRRTAGLCARMRRDDEGLEADLHRRTGLLLDPYFCATKLAWLLRDAGLRRRARAGELAFGTIDSWLAWNLTGRHVTDETNASRTLLWNLAEGEWDLDLLERFRIPAALLPEVHASGDPDAFGATTRFQRSRTSPPTPVTALVGDQQSALFGQGCTRRGEAKVTYGTGCFLLQHTGATRVASRHRLLSTRAARLAGERPQYALEGAVFTAGLAIQWLRDRLGAIPDAPSIDSLAASVPDSGGSLLVPAFTGLGAPHWDPQARGAWLGLTAGTTKAHLAYATLESIALQCTDVLAAMRSDLGKLATLRVDGGAARSDPMLQMQADLAQRSVVRPTQTETTAMGAARLAGLAAGVHPDPPREAGDREFVPGITAAAARRRLAVWRKGVAAVRAFA